MHSHRRRSDPGPVAGAATPAVEAAHSHGPGHAHGPGHVHGPPQGSGNAALAAELTAAPPITEGSVLDAAAASVAPATPEQSPVGRQGPAGARVDGAQQRTVSGVAISGTGVSPDALDAAERIVAALVGGREDVQERLTGVRTRIVIIPSNKRQTEVSEFTALAGTQTFDGRNWDDVRGSGGMLVNGEWVIAVPEENLVEVAGANDAYGADYSVALHELAHTVHIKGMTNDERTEVDTLFAAQSGGQFTDTYGSSNAHEYFAQSTNAFFSVNSIGHEGPDWLQANDPDMYAFLVRMYGTPEAALARAEATGETPEEAAGAPAPATPATATPAAPSTP